MRGAGEGLVGGTGGRLEGDVRASEAGRARSAALAGLGAQRWASAVGRKEKKNWAVRGTGPGREGEEEMAGWLLG